jgi:hypothetical protein
MAAIILGWVINQRIRGRSFLRFIHIGLLLPGSVLLIQSLRQSPKTARERHRRGRCQAFSANQPPLAPPGPWELRKTSVGHMGDEWTQPGK